MGYDFSRVGGEGCQEEEVGRGEFNARSIDEGTTRALVDHEFSPRGFPRIHKCESSPKPWEFLPKDEVPSFPGGNKDFTKTHKDFSKISQRFLQFYFGPMCAHMDPPTTVERCASMDPSHPAPVGIRRAKVELSRLVDEAAEGSPVVISRRGQPLAALISPSDLERFRELERRDEGLQAVLKGSGIRVAPWSTAKILEILALLGGGRGD